MGRKEQLKADLEFLDLYCNQILEVMAALERELDRVEEGGEQV